MSFQLMLQVWMEEVAHIGEGKEFHILGVDELKAREPTVWIRVDEAGFGWRSAMIN
jgi:hypothetical protein